MGVAAQQDEEAMDQLLRSKKLLEKAEDILAKEANVEDEFYQDRKPIKRAGNLAYKAVLNALNCLFDPLEEFRDDKSWYQKRMDQFGSRPSILFHSAYCTLHLSMGYDGNLLPQVSEAGLEVAKEIIDWVEQRLEMA